MKQSEKQFNLILILGIIALGGFIVWQQGQSRLQFVRNAKKAEVDMVRRFQSISNHDRIGSATGNRLLFDAATIDQTRILIAGKGKSLPSDSFRRGTLVFYDSDNHTFLDVCDISAWTKLCGLIVTEMTYLESDRYISFRYSVEGGGPQGANYYIIDLKNRSSVDLRSMADFEWLGSGLYRYKNELTLGCEPGSGENDTMCIPIFADASTLQWKDESL